MTAGVHGSLKPGVESLIVIEFIPHIENSFIKYNKQGGQGLTFSIIMAAQVTLSNAQT